MILVMTKSRVSEENRFDIAEQVSGGLSLVNYDGLSTKEMKGALEKETEDNVVVSADSRMLMFVKHVIGLDNVYIYLGGELYLLKECTERDIKDCKDLMKLFDKGEFSCVS